MRRLSPRIFASTITLYTSGLALDAAGGTTRAQSAGWPLRCSVQTAGASRMSILGALYSETTHVVVFRDFPADLSIGARAASPSQRLGPEVNTQDLLVWDPPGTRTPLTIKLQALGPALDQGGYGVGWIVACKVVT